MGELVALDGGKKDADVAISNRRASRSRVLTTADGANPPWLDEGGVVDAALLITDIEEIDDQVTDLITAREMRKSILRHHVLSRRHKDGSPYVSLAIGDKKVTLKPRESLVCSCHNLELGECSTPIGDVTIEKRVIDAPYDRYVYIENAVNKIELEAARGAS